MLDLAVDAGVLPVTAFPDDVETACRRRQQSWSTRAEVRKALAVHALRHHLVDEHGVHKRWACRC